jgi:DNA polymerase-1
MEEKKLFLLDAYALIYRAYYALIRAPRITSDGFNTSAIFGFCNTLEDILRKENPSHIAVCFDPKGGTFRHEVYAEYKAGRDAQPEDITKSIPYIKRIIDAYRIPAIEIERYEADDIIGTLSRMAENAGFTTYMMTPDKDYGQLVTDKVFMYRPALKGQGFEIRGVQQICERYNIQHPAQVIDMLALEGDASDNIPGCPGVGEKTAAKLLTQFGSIENMLEHTSEIKGALRQKVEDNAEQIKFSKMLATIKTDVPLSITPDQLIRQEPNNEALIDIYQELEFRSFIAKLKSKDDGNTQSTVQPYNNPAHDTQPSLFDIFDNNSDLPEPIKSTYTETDSLESIVASALTQKAIGIALYTEGTSAMTAQWKGIAISTSAGNASYLRIPDDAINRNRVIAELTKIFHADSVTIVSHDIKRTYIILKRNGIDLTAPYYDTAVAHYLLQPEMRHGLDTVAYAYLQYQISDINTQSRTTSKKPKQLTPDEACNATCERADISLRLKDVFSSMLTNELSRLFTDIELPLIRVLAEMEYTGVRIDTSELAHMSQQLTARLTEMETEAYKMAGGAFNIASPMQVGEILFERLKIDPKAKRTKTGAYSTTEEILEKHRATVPLVDLILKIRGLRKLLTTYINALPELINTETGKIHTTFNQTVTATGRISSTDPNLQNIPIRTDDGREIRRAFIPSDGNIILSADYSQIELRLIADISGDADMIDAFLSGADIHQATAAKIYHIPLEEVTDNQRRNAKTANFGIIYGISAFGLSERLGIPRSEAKALIDGYFATYPRIRQYMDESIAQAHKQGYVTTVMGRKRLLPDINSRNAVVRGYAERNAINAPLQGSAADIIKLAMIRIYNEMTQTNLRSRMIIQVHDELIFDIVPNELDIVQEIVIRQMQNAYHGRVPLTVSAGIGHNWLEAH